MATDLHLDEHKDNFEYLKEFYKFADEKNPDLILALGDIADSGFQGVDREKYKQLSQGLMTQLANHELAKRSKHKKIELTPYELNSILPIIAEEIYFKKRYPGHIKEACREYLDLLDQAEWNLQNVYHIFNHTVGENKERTLTLPGNHDMDLEQTILKEIDMHKKSKEVKGFKIAGYGNAIMENWDHIAAGCPVELTVPFNEYPKQVSVLDDKVELVSEPRDFLMQEQPNIVLLHNPMHGYLDFSEFKKELVGSFGFLQYAQQGLSELYFSGHIHESSGIQTIKTKNGRFSVVINPGVLGNTKTFDENGQMRPIQGGSFVEVDLDDETKKFQTAKFYKINILSNGEAIIDSISTIIRDNQDNLKELVTNQLAINIQYTQLKNKIIL